MQFTWRIPLNFNTAVVIVVLALSLLLQRESLAAPAIWEIEGKTNKIYLFGSIHVASQSMYPLGASVENAFNNSQVLVVEVDEAQVDQVKIQQLMMSKGFYTGTETIKDHINSDTFKLLKRLLADAGIPYATVARMKPGVIALTLTVAKIVGMGYSPDLGIDRHFLQRSRGKKEIWQLETSEDQMNLLLSFTDDDLLLRHTLISLDKLEKMVTDLMTAWKDGNINLLEKLMLTDQLKDYPEFEPVMTRLIDDRNVTMAINIEQMLNGNSNYFVVVGAGHLLGKKGIVSLLKKKGLNIKRL